MPLRWGSPPPQEEPQPVDLTYLQREVGQRFPFYDVKVTPNAVVFFCRLDLQTVDEQFESLRLAIKPEGYIPMFRTENGEQLLYVLRARKHKVRSPYINLVLLLVTVFTTTLAGALQWVELDLLRAGATDIDFLQMLAASFDPGMLLNGFIFFSVPLMLILGIHEMGHYIVSKRHHVEASLPFFIPLPPPMLLGTFGAVISTRDPIPNRKALLHIGAAGPLAGFLVAIPVVLIGFFLMQQDPVTVDAAGGLFLVPPLLIQWIGQLFSVPGNAMIHPTLFAGWVGIFLTAVNLLPVGQLDGGHVARAVFKDYHRYVSWAVVIILLGLGLFYTGWFMFAFIVLLFIGTQHQPPLNELSAFSRREQALAVLILVVFLLSFAPVPFAG